MMGHSDTGAGAAPEQDLEQDVAELEAAVAAVPEEVAREEARQVEAPRLDLGAISLERPARTVDIGGATILIRGMTRGEFIGLGIDEDSDARDDEAKILAATVIEPKATADEWRAAIESMSAGTASLIIAAVMAENGLGAEVGRQLARDFRP